MPALFGQLYDHGKEMPSLSISKAFFRDRYCRLAFLALLAVILLFGGASRADALSQVVVRLASIVAICAVATRIQWSDLARVRGPLVLLGLLAVVIGWQLIPVPFSFWDSLAGRAPWGEALKMAGIVGWRPISLAPDVTLNSLLALLPMFALVVVGACAGPEGLKDAIPTILAALLLSALLSIIQIGGDRGYFYAVTNRFEAVGLFANRNHQAFFLACCLPILACWATMRSSDPAAARLRGWIALCSAAGIYPLCLITGSRAGLVLAGLGTLFAVAVWLPTRRRRGRRGNSRAARLAMIGPLLIGAVAILVTVVISRDEALVRLGATHVDELRIRLLPTYVRMASDFFPFGSGFGTFDPVFRFYEPNQYLVPQYLNQAHNDWMQLVIEGGAPALALLLSLGFILGKRAWSLWRAPVRSEAVLIGRMGTAVVALLVAASSTDYPLRTPALGSLFVLAVLWMSLGATRENESHRAGLAVSAE